MILLIGLFVWFDGLNMLYLIDICLIWFGFDFFGRREFLIKLEVGLDKLSYVGEIMNLLILRKVI